jgi:adenylate cyclase
VREPDLLQVKGKTQPVPIYEALDHYDEISFPNMGATLEAFSNGVASYRQRDWKGSMSAFVAALHEFEGDAPSRLYMYRCLSYMENPPPNDWAGVWGMTEK